MTERSDGVTDARIQAGKVIAGVSFLVYLHLVTKWIQDKGCVIMEQGIAAMMGWWHFEKSFDTVALVSMMALGATTST